MIRLQMKPVSCTDINLPRYTVKYHFLQNIFLRKQGFKLRKLTFGQVWPGLIVLVKPCF